MKIETKQLTGVPETMIYTFYMKYLESIRPDGRINDHQYKKTIHQIAYDYKSFEPYADDSPLFFACRSLIFDNAVKTFMTKNPDAAIVSFGSGLDFRFERVDNGTIQWFDLDLPEVIEFRRKLYDETERLRFIPASVLDFSWRKHLPKETKMLFLAEGLFMYFQPEEVKRVFLFLLDAFPDSFLVVDTASPWYFTLQEQAAISLFLKNMHRMMKWSVSGFYEVQEWSPQIRLVDEWSPLQMYGERAPDSLRELFATDALPEFVKEQIIGLTKIWLLEFSSGKVPQMKKETLLDDPPDLFDQ